MAKLANQNLVAFSPHNGLIPSGGPKSLAIDLDVSSITSYDIELETAIETGRLDFVQCVYIDTADFGAQTLLLVFGESNQRIQVKAKTQGYYPVLAPSTKLTVTISAVMAAPGLVKLQLLSMPMPAVSWATA